MIKKITLLLFFIFLTAVYIYSASNLTVVQTNLGEEAFSVTTKAPGNFQVENVDYGELIKGEKLQGSFIATNDFLGQVSIRFYNFQRINPDSVVFRIKEEGTKDWYYESAYTTGQFQPNMLFPFGFPVISNSKAKTYIFEVESLDGKPEHSIGISSVEPLGAVLYQYPKSYLFSNPSNLVGYIMEEKIEKIELGFPTLIGTGIYVNFIILSLFLINLGLNQLKIFNLSWAKKNMSALIIIFGILIINLAAIVYYLKKTQLSMDLTVIAFFVLVAGVIYQLFDLKFKNKNS